MRKGTRSPHRKHWVVFSRRVAVTQKRQMQILMQFIKFKNFVEHKNGLRYKPTLLE